MWLNLHCNTVIASPSLSNIFSPTDYLDGTDPPQRARAISFGQATAIHEGNKLVDELIAGWFRLLYCGFGEGYEELSLMTLV